MGEADTEETGAGDGVSRLMTGGGLMQTGSLGMTESSSSSSSELSRVRSMTGALEELVEGAVPLEGFVVADDDKRIHFFNKIYKNRHLKKSNCLDF